jgi:excisionase family DNA binding protein
VERSTSRLRRPLLATKAVFARTLAHKTPGFQPASLARIVYNRRISLATEGGWSDYVVVRRNIRVRPATERDTMIKTYPANLPYYGDTASGQPTGGLTPAGEPVAGSVAEACRISGLSRSELYRRLRAKKIDAVKSGTRTLIVMESLRRHIASLPPAKFGAE